MNLPPTRTITSKDKEVVLDIEMSPQLPAFSGHFPNNPILPGVVQIDWAVRFAAIHLGITEPASRDFQVKFRNIIRPDMPLSLTLKIDTNNKLSFVYQSGTNIMSSGQLKLETKA